MVVRFPLYFRNSLSFRLYLQHCKCLNYTLIQSNMRFNWIPFSKGIISLCFAPILIDVIYANIFCSKQFFSAKSTPKTLAGLRFLHQFLALNKLNQALNNGRTRACFFAAFNIFFIWIFETNLLQKVDENLCIFI